MISTSSYHRQSFALKLWYIPTPNWSLCTAHLDCIHSPPHLALRALHSMSPLHIHNHLLVNTVCTVITPAINAHIWWGNDHIWWDKVHTLYTYLINVVLLHACTTSFMLQCSELPNTGIKNNKKRNNAAKRYVGRFPKKSNFGPNPGGPVDGHISHLPPLARGVWRPFPTTRSYANYLDSINVKFQPNI